MTDGELCIVSGVEASRSDLYHRGVCTVRRSFPGTCETNGVAASEGREGESMLVLLYTGERNKLSDAKRNVSSDVTLALPPLPLPLPLVPWIAW